MLVVKKMKMGGPLRREVVRAADVSIVKVKMIPCGRGSTLGTIIQVVVEYIFRKSTESRSVSEREAK